MSVFDPHALNRADLPHKQVPRDFDKNNEFRDQLGLWLTAEGEDAQARLMDWCRRDVLFYANALCWTLDSKRHPGMPVRPWISFKEFQDDLFLELEDAWVPPGKVDQVGYDRCWVKSRDMGISHIPAFCASRRFLCFTGQIIYFISEKEELIDDPGDPGAVFPKIDFVHARLPRFMLEGVQRNKLKFFYNGEDGKPDAARGLIKGFATTDIATAGTRPTAIVADEFGLWDVTKSNGFQGSSEGATNSRLFMGNPKGVGNGFHKIATKTDIPRTDIHWTKHPWHRAGLYRSLGDGGDIQYEDAAFWATTTFAWLKQRFPLLAKKIALSREGIAGQGGRGGGPGAASGPSDDSPLRDSYRFIRDGKIRSPYYDHACARLGDARQVAEQHDLDFHGSGSPFYDTAKLSVYIDKMAMVPMQRGELSWDPYTFEPTGFGPHPEGKLHLWCNLAMVGGSEGGRLVPPRKHLHQIGVDVSAGTGASNSAISVWNCVTLNKVARYARNDMGAHRFAEVAFAIGTWFGGCNILFEGGGHGSGFGDRLKELGYPSVFWMADKKGKRRPRPGLHFEGEGKLNLLRDYGRALLDGEAVCRDREALKEGFAFQLGADSLAVHSDALNRSNPGGAKKNHGDCWMADCLSWYRVKLKRTLDRKGLPVEINDEETERRIQEMVENRHARSKW